MPGSVTFDSVIEEISDISRLNKNGFGFTLQSFVINGVGRQDEWSNSIDGVAAVLKNSVPTETLKIYAVKG